MGGVVQEEEMCGWWGWGVDMCGGEGESRDKQRRNMCYGGVLLGERGNGGAKGA